MQELISVIIPVYNTEKYLRNCIESVVNQTYKNVEIILVDDGSTDSSGEICDFFSAKDHRIRVIHKKNQGLSSARNSGISISTGKYLAFVDSDDFIDKTMIEELYYAIKRTKAELAVCSFEYVYEESMPGRVELHVSPIKDEILTSEMAIDKLFQPREWYYVVAWNKLYKRELWNNFCYPVGYIHEDEAVIHHIFKRCLKITTLKSKLYFYRQVPGSIMNRGRNIKSLDKYTAYADRLCCLFPQLSEKQVTQLSMKFWCNFLDDYYYYSDINDNRIYLIRMRVALKKVLPIFFRTKFFGIKDTLGAILFLFAPNIYAKRYREYIRRK